MGSIVEDVLSRRPGPRPHNPNWRNVYDNRGRRGANWALKGWECTVSVATKVFIIQARNTRSQDSAVAIQTPVWEDSEEWEHYTVLFFFFFERLLHHNVIQSHIC